MQVVFEISNWSKNPLRCFMEISVRQYLAEIIKTCAKIVHVLEHSGIFFAALSFPRGSTPLYELYRYVRPQKGMVF